MATAPDYVKILRQKLGEFMLTMLDLHQRGIKYDVIMPTFITALEVEAKVKFPEMISRHETDNLTREDYNSLKQFIIKIITTQKFNSEIEANLLCVLLFNNGFPCRFITNNIQQTGKPSENPEPKDFEYEFYEFKMIFGNDADETKNPNHYTVHVPEELREKLGGKLLNYEVEDEKIQIAGDGDCFYTAVAVWCKIYGITINHLNSITYNVPFEFSKEHFESNMKVRLSEKTDSNPFPEPLPPPLEFRSKAIEIAKNMIGKLVPKGEENNKLVSPIFEDEKLDIINSEDYKAYLQDGVIKNEGTHCNKYKGNK